MTLPKAREPFQFFTRLSLAAATGLKAGDARALLDGLRGASESVLYAHTHRFIQQYQFLVPEPANDFSVWAAEALQDEALSEKLLAVDTVAYSTMGELREALVAALERHLAKHPSTRAAPAGEEFHFTRSIRFSVPTGRKAEDLGEFREALQKVGLASLYLHIFEARLRPPLGTNDFSLWLEGALDEKALARKVARLDPYAQTLEALRESLLKLVDARIEELSHA